MRELGYDGAEAYETTKAHLKERGVEGPTLGPWVTEPAELVAAPVGPGDSVFFVIAKDGGPVTAWAYTESDARLIAAAPELLAALRPFAKFACDPPCEGPCHNCNARAAIRKAEGTNQ